MMMKSLYMMEDYRPEDKPRERLTQCGAEALSDRELLAIVLGTGSLGVSTLDLSQQLLDHFDGSLQKLAQASIEELCAVHGIGPAKACSIRASFALAQRLMTLPPKERYQVSNPRSLANHLQQRFRGLRQEEFWVVLLDIKSCIQKKVLITRGLVNRTLLHSREVFRVAVKEGAANIILVHNHPSGDSTPSPEDLANTEILCDAGEILGINVIDHLIIGEKGVGRHREGFCSLRSTKQVTFRA